MLHSNYYIINTSSNSNARLDTQTMNQTVIIRSSINNIKIKCITSGSKEVNTYIRANISQQYKYFVKYSVPTKQGIYILCCRRPPCHRLTTSTRKYVSGHTYKTHCIRTFALGTHIRTFAVLDRFLEFDPKCWMEIILGSV